MGGDRPFLRPTLHRATLVTPPPWTLFVVWRRKVTTIMESMWEEWAGRALEIGDGYGHVG